MTEVLVLCTANRCRSVMARALLAARLAAVRPAVTVRSAGLLQPGLPPPGEVIAAMAGLGCDVTGHRSRVVSASDLARADLVLGLAREHVRHAAVLLPAAWPRSFTVRELVRRSGQSGPRRAGEPLAGWLARAHHGRDRAGLLGEAAQDDVADPMGGPPHVVAAIAAELSELMGSLAWLGWGAGSSPARPAARRDDSAGPAGRAAGRAGGALGQAGPQQAGFGPRI